MKLKIAAGAAALALGAAAAIVGVNVANAADTGDANVHRASVGVGETPKGDVLPAPEGATDISAKTEAQLEKLYAEHPEGGLAIKIDENGDVTSTPLEGTSGTVTDTTTAQH